MLIFLVKEQSSKAVRSKGVKKQKSKGIKKPRAKTIIIYIKDISTAKIKHGKSVLSLKPLLKQKAKKLTKLQNSKSNKFDVQKTIMCISCILSERKGLLLEESINIEYLII